MIDSQVQAFAELGRLFRGLQIEGFDFAEAKTNKVTDSEILEDLRSTLEEGLGRVDRVYGVTFDGDATFKGKADQKISLGKSKVFAFTISPDQVYYKPINGDEVMQYAESDEGWAAMVEFAATKGKSGKSGRKLNCKPGNYQCGGKCQSDSRGCPSQMSPEQRKAYQSALRKAKKSVSTTPPAANNSKTNKTQATTQATKKKSERQEPNTQPPEISAKDLLSEPNMFEARTVNIPPDLKDALERGDYGSAANKYILEAEGMRFSKSESADATRYANDIADRINQVRSPSQLRGADLYGAEKFRDGPKITSQQKFDQLYDEVTRTMGDGGAGELLPIYKIRRAMGDRVSRADFDEFLYKTTQRRSHRLVESGVEDNARDKFLDSVVTNLGQLRTYISTRI